MSRMFLKTHQKHRDKGFTIVELLIVIIVIAIVAAITIVAYNGIQTRAENTKTLEAVATYVKALKLQAGETGKFPIHTNFPCLGVATETCGTSAACWGVGSVTGQAAFETSIKTYISSMPALSTQSMACNATGGIAKGGLYYSADGQTAWVYYFLRGNVSCGNPGGMTLTKNQAQDTTYCNGSMTP